MNISKYIIKGKEYNKEIDFIQEITNFINSFNVKSDIKKVENGFVIEINTLLVNINEFETQLLKKVMNLIEIKLYTKKEINKEENTSKENRIELSEKLFKSYAKYLRQEKLLAIKYNGSYHLVCNGAKTQAVLNLRELIKKSYEPLPVIYKSVNKAKQLIMLSTKEQELLLSPTKPFIIAKLRNLHRLEKVKYKHKLTPKVNELNNRVIVSIPPNQTFEKIFEIIEFPLVTYDTFISDKDTLIQKYKEKIEIFIDADLDNDKKPLEILQIIYGKVIPIKYNLSCKCNKTSICLDYKKSNIIGLELKPIKLFMQDEPKYKALSLLFSKLTLSEVMELDLPFEKQELEELFKAYQEITKTSNSLLVYFDAIASLSGELHQKNSDSQSIELTEQHYEVCEEGLYDYKIIDDEIDIDIVSAYLKNSTLKHLGSTLVNTIGTIITDRAVEKDIHEVNFCGELFYFRDLSELTIEKLEDENIKVTLT